MEERYGLVVLLNMSIAGHQAFRGRPNEIKSIKSDGGHRICRNGCFVCFLLKHVAAWVK